MFGLINYITLYVGSWLLLAVRNLGNCFASPILLLLHNGATKYQTLISIIRQAPSNMQWQSEAESKAKDKWERNGCSTGIKTSNNPPSSGEYYSGKRGGCFTYGANGKKHYVEHSYCGR